MQAISCPALCVLTKFIPEERLWVTSALSGVAHNAGQLIACMLILRTPGLLVYAPVLAVSGVVTGVFTGIAAKYLLRALRKLKLF